MSRLVLVLDNLRSAHNVGVILRTADGAGLRQVYLCGSTPAPHLDKDPRPPYAQDRAAREIAKTALGAERSLELRYEANTTAAVTELKRAGYQIVALEQAPRSISLEAFRPAGKLALIVGNEVEGVSQAVLKLAEIILEIPMRGQKESLNAAVATGIALYRLSSTFEPF